jgi:hypothetical protein
VKGIEGGFKWVILDLWLQAIGLNSQSTVNVIMFCVLTKQVRRRWLRAIRRACRCQTVEVEELLEETAEMTSESAKTYGSSSSTIKKN